MLNGQDLFLTKLLSLLGEGGEILGYAKSLSNRKLPKTTYLYL